MEDAQAAIQSHYEKDRVFQRIIQALEQAGKDSATISSDDLAPFDALHTGGRAATAELAQLAEFDSSLAVLDVGCGLGGAARFLAETYGCRVHGIDLTQDFVDNAKELSSLVHLDNLTTFEQGSALALAFEDRSFDLVWTEHTQMNIADKEKFYSEIARVLQPGGCLLFHDIFGDEAGGLQFPLPWANEASISFIRDEKEIRGTIEEAGLEITHWQNRNEASLEFFEQSLRHFDKRDQPESGAQIFMGSRFREKIQNLVHHLSESRLSVVMGKAEKPKR